MVLLLNNEIFKYNSFDKNFHETTYVDLQVGKNGGGKNQNKQKSLVKYKNVNASTNFSETIL